MIAKCTSKWVAKLARVAILFGVILGISACGYSEEQWQAQLDKYNRLTAQHQSTGAKLAETEKQLQAAKNRVANLEANLQAMGVDISKLNQDSESRQTQISKLSATLEEREKALAEYKARARQLEAIKQRFERLRAKLQQLTNLGLKVDIRNNRMIISLPGDVLFASGRSKLTKQGEDVLAKVSSVIGADASLRARYYQVAGHTDNKPLKGGVFGDNWGLSLMRARSVLLYMIDPETGKMPINKWSASGYGETDPIANNDSDVGRQKNRRCEIVVVPSAEEMLDLQKIAK